MALGRKTGGRVMGTPNKATLAVTERLKAIGCDPIEGMARLAMAPHKMPAKITIRLKDGDVIEHEVEDYPGLASHPFTWEDSVEKFDKLVAGRIDEGLSREVKEAVVSLQNIQVGALMKLLARVGAAASAAASRTT